MTIVCFFSQCAGHHRHLHSFPTRRSSDLIGAITLAIPRKTKWWRRSSAGRAEGASIFLEAIEAKPDRKSTRLNSSHVRISYAVFCLKKKNNTDNHTRTTHIAPQHAPTPAL